MRVARSPAPMARPATPHQSVAAAFAQAIIYKPEISHAAVRFGLWLAGIADNLGSDSVDIFQSTVLHGYKKDGLDVPGLVTRPKTIRDSVQCLRDHGLLKSEDGDISKVGFQSTRYTFVLH